MMSEKETKVDRSAVIIRVIACVLILVMGFVGLKILKGRKKPPAHAVVKERPLKVEAQSVSFTDVPVLIEAHG